MRPPLAALLLVCCASVAHAGARECAPADRAPAQLATTDHGVALKVQRCLRYGDRAGDWQLYLLGSEERHDEEFVLSSRLVAQLFRRLPDGTLAPQWVLREHIADGEAGAWFSRKLSEFRDLDGSGNVTPMLVLRFVPWRHAEQPADGANEDYDAGRLKIVLLQAGVASTVEAITGVLDDERRTTATATYFALPEPTRRHVQQLLHDWNRDQVFLSDDHGGRFVPRQEKKTRKP
jgi:hypothetical protein